MRLSWACIRNHSLPRLVRCLHSILPFVLCLFLLYHLSTWQGPYLSFRTRPNVIDRLRNATLHALVQGEGKSVRIRQLALEAFESAESFPRTVERLGSNRMHDLDLTAPLCQQRPVPIKVSIPKAVDVQDPGLVIGLTTTVERFLMTTENPRLSTTLDAIAHFATAETTFFFLFSETEKDQVANLIPVLDAFGLRYTYQFSTLGTWELRWVQLVELLAAKASIVDVQSAYGPPWYAIIDDDTFFPDMRGIWSMLAQYPHPESEAYMVGGAVEGKFYRRDKIIHAGGPGIFFSSAAMHAWHDVFKSGACNDLPESEFPQGDVWLEDCRLKTLPEMVRGTENVLHMFLDQYPDMIYEAPGEISDLSVVTQNGKPVDADMGLQRLDPAEQPRLLSVHHWKQLDVDVVAMSSLRRKTGDRGVFHRFLMMDKGDGTDSETEEQGFWVLTNGYNIAYHSLSRPPQRERNDGCPPSPQCWDPAGGDVWDVQTAVDMILNSIEVLAHITVSDYLTGYNSVRPPDPPEMTQRYNFKSHIEGTGDEPWIGYYVHETDDLIDIVELSWI